MNASVSPIVFPNLAVILESATLAELDRALVNLSASTLLVAQQRNKHILAARTNQDILEIIFSVIIDWQGSAGLRSVSQVCREWRVVALAAPLLWRQALSLSVNPNWMFEMLRRTMHVPLTIRISHHDIHRDMVYANLLSIADQFWRFETLEIDAPRPYICEFFGFVPFDSDEAPRLRILSLSGKHWQGLLDDDEVLPDELLALSAPNLEHLALENFPFDWDVLKFGLAHSIRLSVLHICYPGESDAPHTLSISELLATLKSIISLRELKLHNVLKVIGENLLTESVTPTTALPALRTLDLQANIQFCSGFLNGVEAPALVELDVECNSTNEAGDTPLFTTSAFMIGISRIAPHDPYNIFSVLHQKGKLWISLRSNRTGAFCRILVPEVNDGPTLERTLRKLADMPSVHSTERLEIGFSKDAHRKVIGEVWAYLFERLNKVSSLDLGTYPVPRILQILYCNAKGALEAQKQGKEVSVLLPSLETIAIATSLTLCVLVDMIAELRETVGAPIDRHVTLRKMDTYQAARERITVWLEGSFTGAQAEGEGESVGESEDSED
ncbi:hypothetical protein EDD15DRAFT_2204122 [Pisolithus albus]|nr:hypothetical protein EDD15DRAFT_2204122 [Pisolithus albus]